MAGLTRRRLYKPERSPARKRGVVGKNAPICLPDASRTEIATAVYALCRECGILVGQGAEYDPLKDKYVVIGKSMATGKAQEVMIEGLEIGAVIKIARSLNGGRLGHKNR